MAFNGSGVFVRLYNWVNDKANGIKIRADRMDNEMNGFATGLSACITRDGQSPATADLPMGGYKHTGVDDATALDEYATYGQLLGKSIIYCPTVGGTANAITLLSGLSISAYADGQVVAFIVSANNTGAVTVSLDGLSAVALTKSGSTALIADDIKSGWVLFAAYDGTRFQIISQKIINTDDLENDAVTFAKLQNISADTLIGRSASGTGSPHTITCTAAGRALLDDADNTAQRATLEVYDTIIGFSSAEYTANSDLTTAIPVDDTIPQNTEGTQILSISYACSSATNKIRLSFSGFCGQTSGATKTVTAAIFGSDSANAKAVGVANLITGSLFPVSAEKVITPGTTSAVTYTVRVGTNDGTTMRMNGIPVGRYYGGVAASILTIEEIRA
jgi:hypothetical protein